jgi:hypothetical protein
MPLALLRPALRTWVALVSGASRRPRLREGSPITDPAYSRVACSWSAVESAIAQTIGARAAVDHPELGLTLPFPDLLLERGIGIKIVMGLGGRAPIADVAV